MEAIILAGGKGTRLQSVVKDIPKPMAPINGSGKSFLSFLLDELKKHGVTKFYISVGYMAEVIISSFGNSYKDIPIHYIEEKEPLGTGGALKLSLSKCEEDNVIVVNGDTYFDVPLKELYEKHIMLHADVTLAVKEMCDFDRYGTVEIKDGFITQFREKEPCKHGFINGGVAVFRRDLFAKEERSKFSLENDFLSKKLQNRNIRLAAMMCDGYFIDIGIPEDYYRAKRELGR